MKKAVLLALAGAGAIALGAVATRSWLALREVRRELREALFSALRPVRLANCTLERFGAPHDGGYLLCANLLDGARAAYSYGIHADDSWGCDVSKRYRLTAHQYDCFDLRRPACAGGTFDFHEECVGPASELLDGRRYDTVANQIRRNGDAGKRLVVKMDIENAELDVLLATPDDVLERIEQLVLELHRIDELKSVRLIDKLKRTFRVAHVHANNYACPWGEAPFPSGANEVLFVNQRLAVVEGDGRQTPAPTVLAASNYPELPECGQPAWPQ